MTDPEPSVPVEAPLPHGSKIILDGPGGHPIMLRDRHGRPVVQACWSDAGELLEARFRIPPAASVRWIDLKTNGPDHPILGPRCFTISIETPTGARRLSLGGALDWARPAFVPPLDRPGALPPGAGTAILSWVARLMRLRRVDRVRYRGPYPSLRLFDALLETFTLIEPDEVARARPVFVQRAEEAAFTATAVEPEVDWRPDPFERHFDEDRDVVVQQRGERGSVRSIERIFVGEHAYERSHAPGTQVVGARVVELDEESSWASARVVLGGEPWRYVCSVDGGGRVVWKSDAVRRIGPSVVSEPDVGEHWRAVLGGILARRAPVALAQAIEATVVRDLDIHWGDPGDDVCGLEGGQTPESAAASLGRGRGPTLLVHAAIAGRFQDACGRAPQAQRLFLAKALLSEVTRGLEPTIARLAQSRLELQGAEPFEEPPEGAAEDLDAETAELLMGLTRGEALPAVDGEIGPPRHD